MALDPESQRLIDLMAAADRPAWNTLSPKAARELYLSLRPGAQGPLPAGVKVVDRAIPGLGKVVKQNADVGVAAAINSLGKEATLEGKPARTFALRFVDGDVYLGPLKVGQVPPLF